MPDVAKVDTSRPLGYGGPDWWPGQVIQEHVSGTITRPRLIGRPRTNPALLTERETQVAQLLSAGQANAAIARTLHISDQTVKNHVCHILLKLGVRSRTAIAVWAYANGLLS